MRIRRAEAEEKFNQNRKQEDFWLHWKTRISERILKLAEDGERVVILVKREKEQKWITLTFMTLKTSRMKDKKNFEKTRNFKEKK